MKDFTLDEEIELLQSGDWFDKIQGVLTHDEHSRLGWAIGDVLETMALLRSLTPEPETNADRIRAMSDEELARWLEYEGGGACAEVCGWLEWLQQPAEEDT